MKKIFLGLFILTGLYNCGEKAEHSIDGKINTLGLQPNQQVYLYKVENQIFVPIDSAVIDKEGSFEINVKEPKNGVFHFGVNVRNTLPLVLNEESKEIEVNINNNQQLSLDYSVTGSEASNEIASFSKEVFNMMQLNQNLRQKAQQLNPTDMAGQQQIQAEYAMASKNFLDFRNSYIEKNKNSIALIAVIEQIDTENELELLKEVSENLSKSMPNSPYSENVKKYIEDLEQSKLLASKKEKLLSIGNEAPELDFPNPQGENIKLSSLRGKVVLLDFWASWCKPCRAENPNVVATYNKYKDQGFDVYSFSLDKDKSQWVNAIEKDGLIWKNHTSDLKFWQTEAINIYGFNSIPFTVLIDRDGKIIAKGLRGPALEAKLKEVL